MLLMILSVAREALVVVAANYNYKTVPNVTITMFKGAHSYTVLLDNIKEYEQYWDSHEGWRIIIFTSLLSPTDYDTLTADHYDSFSIQCEEQWTSYSGIETATHISPPRITNHFTISNSIDFMDNEATEWTLEFTNEHY